MSDATERTHSREAELRARQGCDAGLVRKQGANRTNALPSTCRAVDDSAVNAAGINGAQGSASAAGPGTTESAGGAHTGADVRASPAGIATLGPTSGGGFAGDRETELQEAKERAVDLLHAQAHWAPPKDPLDGYVFEQGRQELRERIRAFTLEAREVRGSKVLVSCIKPGVSAWWAGSMA